VPQTRGLLQEEEVKGENGNCQPESAHRRAESISNFPLEKGKKGVERKDPETTDVMVKIKQIRA